jgi:4,5-DOPA dioxygenase extradiol
MGKIILTSYLSHGAPNLLVERTKIQEVYKNIGQSLKEYGVDTVVMSSPHYFTPGRFEVESRESIPCVHDYYGFPKELYQFSYKAKNNIELSLAIIEQAKKRNIRITESNSWGLDHGAWIPLYFMFPEEDIKVVNISITDASPQTHFSLGTAISDAVAQIDGTIAVLGTGSPVHRLDLIRLPQANPPIMLHGDDKFTAGENFDEKLIEAVASGDLQRIVNISEEIPLLFRDAAPEGNLNPLYVALGASDTDRYIGATLFHEFMYYGTSLVAIILSADGALQRSLIGPASEQR